jgi:P27 family predicted phage terminase small subunit
VAGRRPLPTALKELAGNPGHRPLNDAEAKPEPRAPEMPKGMCAAARREWGNIVPLLLKLGLLTRIDGKALAAYCDSYAHWEQARKDIKKYGLVIQSPKCDKLGNVIMVSGDGSEILDEESGTVRKRILYELKANPAVSIYNTFAKLMKAYLIEFGLTPASRSKLKIEKPADSDPMEDFLRNRGADGAGQVKAAAPLMFNTGKTTTGMPEMPSAGFTDFEA